MAPDLKDELKQQKPFRSLHQEAELSLVRTTNMLENNFEQLLKPHGITGTQYNVLRILRGAGPEGLCRNEVSERLLNRMPDATRLLDRMEAAGLVTRERSTEDRRLVRTQLTEKGRKLVNSLDDRVEKEHERQLGHLSEKELRSLIDLLTLIRSRKK
jgi:DNA-binding MarR family transcriptional regulator